MLTLEPLLRDVAGEIGEDQVGPCPFERAQCFAHDAFFIQCTRLCREFDHRVFAADLIGGERQQAVFANAGQQSR